MDSMERKIRNFLKDVGYSYEEGTPGTMQLLRYFEQEYGLEMMGLLEQEWLDEQLERDLRSGVFQGLRERVAPEDRDSFDTDLATFGL